MFHLTAAEVLVPSGPLPHRSVAVLPSGTWAPLWVVAAPSSGLMA